MNYLSVESLSKSYGPKVLFKDISFGISQGQKVALVARNGAGKSSLLKIISGKEPSDSGKVTFRKDLKSTYLEQDPILNPDKTIMEVVFDNDHPVIRVVKEYELSIEEQSKNDNSKTRDRLQKAMEQMDQHNAWDFESRIKQILGKLNIHDTSLKVAQLSGGQKKRVALSSVLINEPDLIIMDEPTNHLDVEMIEWLEGYLISRDVALLLVTHDRYFLDSVCNEIIELDSGKLYHYEGSFSYFIEKKAERETSEASELDKAKNLYRRELEWVRKMPRARTVKSKSRVDAFVEVEKKATGKKVHDKLELDVKMTRLGGKILELIKIGKSFSEIPIMKSFSYTFKKNEKIGIVGKNGVGKSTLLNIIMGLEKYDAGKVQTGETVVFGYYSQAGLKLNEDKRVIEVIKDSADVIQLSDGTKLSAALMLQRFQFSPEMQYSYVSKLSGGEKRKLYLLTILMKNPNFLILDEPTNDLDIITLGILEEFLQSFEGCLLIVSHDRYFMDKLVDHLFVFEGEGKIRDFPGNYTQYREKLSEEEKKIKTSHFDKLSAGSQSSPNLPAGQAGERKNNNLPSEKRKFSFKEKHEYDQLAKEIEALEKRKSELTEQMNSGIEDHSKLHDLAFEFREVNNELDQKSLRWLELSELQ